MLQLSRKIASALCIAAAVVLVAMWVRSYYMADRLHGRFWGRESFLLASKQGRMTVMAFRWHGAANWWRWETRRYAASDDLSFPVGPMRQYESTLGFGLLRRPLYHVMRPRQTLPDGSQILLLGAASATLKGSGVIVPYWFFVLLTGTVFFAVRLKWPWRFSIKDLMIGITFVAAVLALTAILDRPPD